MMFNDEHNHKDPETGEFEKLEFLPEQPDPIEPDEGDETGQIVFTPEAPEAPEEPPISFNPDDQPASEAAPEPRAPEGNDLDLDAETPFELFGTSLFGDLDDEEGFVIDPLDDVDDDLDF